MYLWEKSKGECPRVSLRLRIWCLTSLYHQLLGPLSRGVLTLFPLPQQPFKVPNFPQGHSSGLKLVLGYKVPSQRSVPLSTPPNLSWWKIWAVHKVCFCVKGFLCALTSTGATSVFLWCSPRFCRNNHWLLAACLQPVPISMSPASQVHSLQLYTL